MVKARICESSQILAQESCKKMCHSQNLTHLEARGYYTMRILVDPHRIMTSQEVMRHTTHFLFNRILRYTPTPTPTLLALCDTSGTPVLYMTICHSQNLTHLEARGYYTMRILVYPRPCQTTYIKSVVEAL